jgi:hypothetical protein
METIAVISAANSAISTIKEMVGNGQDLMSCGSQLSEYFNAKSEIQKRSQEKGQSDLDLFLANEQLKQREEELKNMMIYQGRGGMWSDWLDFQAKQKKARDDAKKAEQAKKLARRKAIKSGFVIGGVVLLSIGAIAGAGYLLYLLIQLKG